jgi:hypothetical protein
MEATMTDKQTGGPAFPLHNHGAQTLGLHLSGMTLRDYFAGQALQGYCSDPDWRMDMDHLDTAFASYSIADAMLKARDGNP